MSGAMGILSLSQMIEPLTTFPLSGLGGRRGAVGAAGQHGPGVQGCGHQDAGVTHNKIKAAICT